MALWGNQDLANNSPLFAGALVSKAPNTANRDELFGNTTLGTFGIDSNEVIATPGMAHAGWILRKVGTGGRAGRVMTEVLVASGSITGDAEDVITPDYVLVITAQPANANIVGANATTFSANAKSTPAGATITYQWQANTGSGFSNLTNAGVYSNVATKVLSISDGTGLTGNQYRVVVGASGANSVTSSAATLTVS